MITTGGLCLIPKIQSILESMCGDKLVKCKIGNEFINVYGAAMQSLILQHLKQTSFDNIFNDFNCNLLKNNIQISYQMQFILNNQNNSDKENQEITEDANENENENENAKQNQNKIKNVMLLWLVSFTVFLCVWCQVFVVKNVFWGIYFFFDWFYFQKLGNKQIWKHKKKAQKHKTVKMKQNGWKYAKNIAKIWVYIHI